MMRYKSEPNHLPHVARWEREGFEIGFQQGFEIGFQQGYQRGLRLATSDALNIRFELLPEDITARLEQIEDPEALRTLLHEAIMCDTLATFRAVLARYSVA